MNCKICGAELKKPGELCNNCMNKMMKEQEKRNDKKAVFSFKKEFVLGYELLRHIEQIGIVLFLIIIILTVSLSYWRYAVFVGCFFSIGGMFYLLRTDYVMGTAVCTLYQTKLVYKYGKIKKKVIEVSYSEIEDIFLQQGAIQKLFGVGTIVIKRKTRNLLEKNIFIDSVKNADKVFEEIAGLFNS